MSHLIVKGRRRAAKSLDRRRRRGNSVDTWGWSWAMRERARGLSLSCAAAWRRVRRALDASPYDDFVATRLDQEANAAQSRYLRYARPRGLA